MTKILCVDDDADGIASGKEVLESDGHEVREAVFGADALHIIQTEEIELAIFDSYLRHKWIGARRGDEAAESCSGDHCAFSYQGSCWDREQLDS